MNKTDSERIHRFNCLACDLDALYHQAAKKLAAANRPSIRQSENWNRKASCIWSSRMDEPKRSA